MDRPSLRTVSISDFLEWRSAHLLVLSPKFQRRPLWPRSARLYLIDTIVRGLPVPKLYMRQNLNRAKKIVREVVDGQQRVGSVLDFYDGKIEFSRDHELYPGKGYKDLPKYAQDAFLKYEFSVDVLIDALDADVLDIFGRINSYSVPLNAQEKRNARYRGAFKQTVYKLGLEHLEYWKKNRILSDQAVARMREAELTSELVVAMLDGLQDKKKSLDGFYKRWDDRFSFANKATARFRDVIAILTNALGDDLAKSKFRKPAMFYSLFLAVYELKYGQLGKPESRSRDLTSPDMAAIRRTVSHLSKIRGMGEAAPSKYQAFVQASSRQTDNVRPRQIRHQTILQELKGD